MPLHRPLPLLARWATAVQPRNAALPLALIASLMLASEPVPAIGFDYALDELRITGNLEFFDDFEDGSRTNPPTSALEDWRGTVSVEEGGFLTLNSDHGFYPRPDLGRDLNWIAGRVGLATPIVDDGSETTTISATFRPDVPGPGSDGIMTEHYTSVLGTGGFQSVEIGVQAPFAAAVTIFFFDNRFFADPATGGFLGRDFVSPSSITGNIVLELTVDHATDTVVPRYSLDGGITFVDGSEWAEVARPGPVFDHGDEAFVFFIAYGSAEASPMEIDVRPLNDDPNTITAKPEWPILVALLGSDTEDATAVDAASLAFGPEGAAAAYDWVGTEDVNQDGVDDQLTQFLYGDTGLPLGEGEACLLGRLADGRLFKGCDETNVVMPPCGFGFELALLLPPLMWLRARRRGLTA